MDTQKQIIERLKQASNVLVTVSKDPSVDQLAALLGLGLALTKLDKHASAVYSGETPSTIDFLQPQETIEKNTDSLRDFIISLDKSKADKLRYKVEDSVVRIFITPYRTSITRDDLDFSQGDFNVDVVVALGVHEQQDLDQAITAHGRIFHDATVITVNNQQAAELGSINWLSDSASSISEMVTLLVGSLGKDVFDEQIATALLTGIVAETGRFSNEKTSANTMKASAVLMAAGANQQLVATKLEEVPEEPEENGESNSPDFNVEQDDTPPEDIPPAQPKVDDGTLQIIHDEPEEPKEPEEIVELPEVQAISTDENSQEYTPPEPHNLPVPGLTITPTSGANDEPQLPPQEPESFPKISKAYASGESALYASEHNTNITNHHQLMHDQPEFSAYDTNTDSENSEVSDPLSLPTVEENSSGAVDNSFVLGDRELSESVTVPPPPSYPAPEKPEPIAVVSPPVEPITPASPNAGNDAPSTHFVPRPGETLAELEREVRSPYAELSPYDELDMQQLEPADVLNKPDESVDAARNAVAEAMVGSEQRLEPIIALNAQPLGEPLHGGNGQPTQEQPFTLPAPEFTQSVPSEFPVPPSPAISPTAAPPLPPPIMPPFPQ
jgi:hypothetical protein